MTTTPTRSAGTPGSSGASGRPGGASAAGTGGRRPRPSGGMSRDAVENGVIRVLRPLVVVVLLLVSVFPFYYMVVLSLRPLDAVLRDPGALWVPPDQVNPDTYAGVLRSVQDGGQGFLTFIGNSLLVALATVALSMLVAVPGAYAVSRLEFFGRRHISAMFLGVYFFPAILLAVPLFVFFTRIGLRGSLVGLLVVYVAQVAAVTIYMLRNYFDTIPVSLEEAAAIDGATRLQVMRKIALPLAMPAIVSNGLFVFMIAWNEFLFALLFLVERRERWTVSLGLSQLAGSIEVPTTVLMAGSVILTLPIVVLFFASERLLVGGLTAGAEKG